MHERRQGKEQARKTKAYHLLVVVPAKRASVTCISSKAIFKLLSSGLIPTFGTPVLSQRIHIHAGSLGQVRRTS
jgi:hypothetical protein